MDIAVAAIFGIIVVPAVVGYLFGSGKEPPLVDPDEYEWIEIREIKGE